MKRIIAFALFLLLLLSLCGCEADQDLEIPEAVTTEQVAEDTGFSLGKTMPDLQVSATDGEQYHISEILQEKKLVVLNFWFENCSWCQKEFPVMELGYQRYKADVEILALNPVDSGEAIGAFAKDSGYSFPMASCSRDLALAFGINGYPTSVFIDREGKISLIHAGAITDAEVFYQVFDHYTAEDYVSGSYLSISEIVN